MSDQVEIDVGKIKGGRYYLDIDGERVLVETALSLIVDRIEKELKEKYGIVEKKGRFKIFGK